MKAIEAYGDLIAMRGPIFETREAAVRLGSSVSRASHLLRSLEEAGLVRRVRQGLWALHPDVDPLIVPPYLTAPFPAYVSFWSALARHGMIEQVPRQYYVASLDRARQITTTLGTYAIHHLAPDLFSGFTGSDETGYLATPEKALFDTVYLRAVRGGKTLLPELELPEGFQTGKLEGWTSSVARQRLRTLVSRGLAQALASVGRPPS